MHRSRDLKSFFAILLNLVLPWAPLKAAVLPPAQSVEESKQAHEERLRRLLAFASQAPLPAAIDDNKRPDDNNRLESRDDVTRWSAITTAKILRGDNLEREEAILLDPSTQPFAEVGSSFRHPGEWCARSGDYDFSLLEYLRTLLVAREIPGSLSLQAQTVLREKLLVLKGGHFRDSFRLPCLPAWPLLKETENHRLMMAVAQYLNNQIWWEETAGDARYDNQRNGMKQTLLAMLRKIFDSHFEEYNSRPYQQFSLQALHLLYGFTHDSEVKQKARILLDYASLWMSVQSLDLRRFSPFRRQPQYRYDPVHREPWMSWQGDGEVQRWAFLAGNYGSRASQDFDFWSSPMLTAAVSHYRLPDTLLSLALDKGRNPYFIVGHHRNFEAYAAGPGYLLSAGGVFDKEAPPAVNDLRSLPRWLKNKLVNLVADWTDQQHGWSMPTVLIPEKDKSSALQQMLRFEGHPEAQRRQNSCVAPHFLCGASLEIPPAWEDCAVKRGPWTFVALDGVSCPVRLGLYLAIFRKPCVEKSCYEQSSNGSFGFVELTHEPALWEDLQANALSQGENFDWNKPFTYQTVIGEEITAIMMPKLGERSIRVYRGQGQGLTFPASLWQGERLQGLGVRTQAGRIEVEVPALQDSLVLDWGA